MAIVVSIGGTAEMKRLLKEFKNDTFKKKVLTASYRKAAKPFVKAARAKAPVANDYVFRKDGTAIEPGTLKRSIGSWTYRKLNAPHLFMGAKQGSRALKYDGWYYKFIELGTTHIAPKPFLGPAWNSTKGQVSNVLDKEFKGILSKFKSKYNL